MDTTPADNNTPTSEPVATTSQEKVLAFVPKLRGNHATVPYTVVDYLATYVEHANKPTYHLSEKFCGGDYVVPYLDFDKTLNSEADPGEDVKSNFMKEVVDTASALFPDAAPGNIGLAARHGLKWRKGDRKQGTVDGWRYYLSGRAYIRGFKIRVRDIPIYIRKQSGLAAKEMHPSVDLSVYKEKEQLLACVGSCKDVDTTDIDHPPRYLTPLGAHDGKDWPIEDYLVQHFHGDEVEVKVERPGKVKVTGPRRPAAAAAATPPEPATATPTADIQDWGWLNTALGLPQEHVWKLVADCGEPKLVITGFRCLVKRDVQHSGPEHSAVLVSPYAVTVNCFAHGAAPGNAINSDTERRLIRHFFPSFNDSLLLPPIDEKDPLAVHKRELMEESFDGSTFTMARLACHLTKGMIICQRRSDWYQFGPHVWRPLAGPPGNLVAEILEKEYAKLLAFAEELPIRTDMVKERIKTLKNLISKQVRNNGWRVGLMKEMEEILEEPCRHIKFDVHPFKLAFRNGVYELRTGTFRNGLPEDYLSKCLTYDLPSETDEEKRAFIEARVAEIMPYEDDRFYLNMALCTALERCNVHELLFIFSGIGRNGKGLIKDFMLESLDQDVYCKAPPAELLTCNRPASYAASPDLVDLIGATAIFFSEPIAKQEIKTSTVKGIIGNDSTRHRQNYGEQGTVKPTYTTFLLCNTIPNMDADKWNIWPKVRVIDFPSRFLTQPGPSDPLQFPVDPTLKLQIPDLAPHWMLYLLDQYKVYASRNYTLPDPTVRMKGKLAEYQKSTNILWQFAEDCIEVNGGEQ
ncbi:hypothetical protein HK097_008410, partial [Rhizophlyctis rosea]